MNVPVVAQSKVPLVQRVQKTCGDAKGAVLGRSRRQASRIVDAPVVVAHHSVPVDAETVSLDEDVSVGTQTVSRKRKISMEAEFAESADGIEHGLVQGRECRREMDETRESHAAGEDLDLLPVARNMEASGSHLQAMTGEERIEIWTQDLREIRRMVEFLVRRERKLDVKADVAVRRVFRLEKERSQLDDEEREASLLDALADRTKVVKLVVDKWFVNKGFGFGKVPTGEVIFIHASVVRGAGVLMIGADAWVQVVRDDARAQEGIELAKPGDTPRGKRRETSRETSKVAEQVRRAAELTAELAAQSEKEVSEVCSQPPGLHDELAAVAPQPTSSLFLVTSNPLPAGQGFSSFSRKFRGRQPRSDTGAQEAAALAEETLSFFVKATGKDEASMQPELKGMKLEALRRE